eukprot:s179_g42.t1
MNPVSTSAVEDWIAAKLWRDGSVLAQTLEPKQRGACFIQPLANGPALGTDDLWSRSRAGTWSAPRRKWRWMTWSARAPSTSGPSSSPLAAVNLRSSAPCTRASWLETACTSLVGTMAAAASTISTSLALRPRNGRRSIPQAVKMVVLPWFYYEKMGYMEYESMWNQIKDRLDNYRRFGNYDLETTVWKLRLGN